MDGRTGTANLYVCMYVYIYIHIYIYMYDRMCLICHRSSFPALLIHIAFMSSFRSPTKSWSTLTSTAFEAVIVDCSYTLANLPQVG
jgi:hypothetical protein